MRDVYGFFGTHDASEYVCGLCPRRLISPTSFATVEEKALHLKQIHDARTWVDGRGTHYKAVVSDTHHLALYAAVKL